jgi:hypothetical protein
MCASLADHYDTKHARCLHVAGAVAKLREQEFSAVVIDQCLMEAEPDEGELMLNISAAFPVYVNCVISGIERVVQEVRSALSGRVREEEIARASASVPSGVN